MIKFIIGLINDAIKPLVDKQNAICDDISEIKGDVRSIKERLARGDERLDEHSDFIGDYKKMLAKCKDKTCRDPADTTAALERKANSPMGWISVAGIVKILLAVAALVGAFFGGAKMIPSPSTAPATAQAAPPAPTP